jgi:Zn finger protein HypA/HybF involved in hydrogenase expression
MENTVEPKETRKLNECTRCKWQWFPRKDKVIACPKCHSPYWDKPRQR